MSFTKKDLKLAWEWGSGSAVYSESGYGPYDGPLNFDEFYARLDELREKEKAR